MTDAGKYRKQLREVEADRDALSARLSALRTLDAEQAIESLGVRPAAVWAAGTTVEDLTGDGDTVDPDKVTAAVDAATEALGIARRPASITGMTSGAMKPTPPADRWQQAFQPQEKKQ